MTANEKPPRRKLSIVGEEDLGIIPSTTSTESLQDGERNEEEEREDEQGEFSKTLTLASRNVTGTTEDSETGNTKSNQVPVDGEEDNGTKKSSIATGITTTDEASFIGADGKLYMPSKVEGDFELQEIPPPASSSSKPPKRRPGSARSKRASSARHKGKSKQSIKMGLGEAGGKKPPLAASLTGSRRGSSDGGLRKEDRQSNLSDMSTRALDASTHMLGDGKPLRAPQAASSLARPSLKPRAMSAIETSSTSRRKGRKDLSLENIQDLFTRAWTFSYMNPSKTH